MSKPFAGLATVSTLSRFGRLRARVVIVWHVRRRMEERRRQDHSSCLGEKPHPKPVAMKRRAANGSQISTCSTEALQMKLTKIFALALVAACMPMAAFADS